MDNLEKKPFNWYDKNYKLILIVPTLILIFSIVYLFQFQAKNGDVIYKDVSLTGGTSLTIFDSNIKMDKLLSSLVDEFPDLQARTIEDIRTNKQLGIILETRAKAEEIIEAVEKEVGYSLDEKNSSVEFSGSSISEGFYKQLRFAVLIAFVLMAIVIFIIFRNPIPSLAVILAAFADIIMTITLIDILGMQVSSAGIVAILMLIGYSVDTDILLTTRVLKTNEGSVNERIWKSFKTGILMTLTAIVSVAVSLLIVGNYSEVLKQMFEILLIGLGFDIINTWVTNASIIKWYMESKK